MQSATEKVNLRQSKKASGYLGLALLVCMFSLGCDDTPEGMAEVSGVISWNGEPLEQGYVTFVPESRKNPQAGKIKDGRFQFNAYSGVNVVQVFSQREGEFNAGMNQHNVEQFIPDKYNNSSELLAEVTSAGENVFEFALKGE